jgi:outer membrane receptor protein involved in Fe transport
VVRWLDVHENNANVAGDTNGEGATTNPVTGTGAIPSYMVVNVMGTYHLGTRVDLFARVVNVLNKQYATAGFLTDNAFNPNGPFRADPDDWTNENAVSPAPPRAVWGGVRVRF